MALEIKEFIGSSINIRESLCNSKISLTEGYNVIDPIHKDSIMQDIEGIHVGPTRNFTWYMEEALDYSLKSWTEPYQKPLIMHHNETDGKIIGRIVSAEKLTKNTRSGTPALLFTCNVPDKEGKEQILDGRLKTTSIGVIAHDVRCSICGQQITLDEYGSPECGHMRGESYKGNVCYWQVYKMEAKELSYVIVPSDIYAHNIRTYKPEAKDINLTEGLNLNEGKMKDMAIEKGIDTQESQIITEEGAIIVDNKVAETEEVVQDQEVKETPETTEPAEEEAKEAKEEATAEEKENTEVEELKATIKTLEDEKAQVAKDLEDVKLAMAELQAKVEKTEADLNAEVILKDEAQSELTAVKAELRECTEENLNAYRSILNKSVILKESLQIRTIDSIKDSIVDLKEELAGLNAVKNITEAMDPTIQPKEKNQKTVENDKLHVKENKTKGNIDLEEGTKNLLAKFLL